MDVITQCTRIDNDGHLAPRPFGEDFQKTKCKAKVVKAEGLYYKRCEGVYISVGVNLHSYQMRCLQIYIVFTWKPCGKEP